MARKYLSPLDMAGNELLNFRVQNLPSFPAAGAAGKTVFRTSDGVLGVDTGSEWFIVAQLDSPTFTGNPTAPTQDPGNNSTRLATTAFVTAALAAGGFGDMLKSVYDTNNNGKVDAAQTADAAPWSGITSKPTTLAGYGITNALASAGLLTSADNVDSLTVPGAYYWSSGSVPTNAPGSHSAAMIVIPGGAGVWVQMSWRISTGSAMGDTYVRVRAGGSWTAWRKTSIDALADVPGLVDALAGKAASSHTHLAADITDLNTAISTQIVAYWDSIAGSDANVDTIREVLDMVLASAAAVQEQIARYNADFGNGSATSYAITHNLNSLDVTVEIYEKATGQTVYCDVTRTNANVVTIAVSPAPASNALRVVIKK